METMRVKKSFNNRGKGIYLSDFLKHAMFVDPFIPADITEGVRKELCDLHPSMIIGGGVIGLEMYQIRYSYTTKRESNRENKKLIIMNSDPEPLDMFERSIMVEDAFLNWVEQFNTNYSYRAISNVKVLEIVPYANANLAIG